MATQDPRVFPLPKSRASGIKERAATLHAARQLPALRGVVFCTVRGRIFKDFQEEKQVQPIKDGPLVLLIFNSVLVDENNQKR
jgi:hypothetical protein